MCGIGLLLAFGAHIITTIVTTIAHGLSVIAHFISGGPAVWFGCLLALLVYLVSAALAACGTNPTNLCALFGR